MTKPDFTYTTYIKTTPEKVWQAITNPEFTHQYWGNNNVSDWRKGSEWKHVDPQSGEVRVVGKVVESNPFIRLVLTWAGPEDLTDVSEVIFDIAANEDMVCLNVVHGKFKPNSTMADRVSQGWPRVLSGLKSFLETGQILNIWAGFKHRCSDVKKAS